MIGLGCMRLSTSAVRDDVRGVAVIRAALDAGATLLDSADAYCLDERDTGHNERLIARALDGWVGDREACEASRQDDVDACVARLREALGVDVDIACCPHDAGPPVC